CMQGIEAPLTF
nr:immunoglobulin light chain junction region [Macaca mulatta]MOW07976.1 immunoglobulin light chain junction region [Macaca mulatta]MOW08234.1 immunoglobulin light chain junction region [Macaca mulatta]MOW08235.1 immunoglobulin light chain junction region [Macaca mulatta]MOW08327.1 immunoglobulin light chain junction region [Macaca mulatta]